MKNIFLVLLTCSSLSLLSQNYTPILLNGPVHFQSEQGYMVPYRIDSAVQRGDTTDYYSFHMIRPIGDEGYLNTLKGGSWIGEKIEKRPNWEWRFYNFEKKPLVLMQNAIDEQSWVFYQSNDGSYFQARVHEVVNKLVLGQTDSVKQICLQYFNSEGNAADHPFNNDTLELSKNFGFLTVFEFYYFPYSGYDFNDINSNFISGKLRLAGIEELELGYRNLTAMDIFTYNIDDEVHMNQVYNGPCAEYISYKIIRKITDRNISPSMILNYRAEYCVRKRTFIYETEVETIDTFHYFSNLSYTLNDYSFLDKLSMQPIFNASENYTFLIAKHDYKQISGGLVYYPVNADTIGLMMVDGYTDSFFYNMLGGPYINDQAFDGCGFTDNIKYYKVSGYECGTPYNCQSLLPVEEFKNSEITISPNPINETFKIEGFDKSARLEIWNIQGQNIMNLEVLPGRKINATSLKTGMYLFKLQVNNQTICKRVWKN